MEVCDVAVCTAKQSAFEARCYKAKDRGTTGVVATLLSGDSALVMTLRAMLSEVR